MKSAYRFLAIGASFVTVACSSSPTDTNKLEPAPAHLHAASATYSPGERAQIDIDNLGLSDLGYGVCVSDVQQLVAGKWISTSAFQLSDGCDAVLIILPVGETGLLNVFIPLTVPNGTYRVRVDGIRQLGDNTELFAPAYSDAFTVARNQ